MSSCFDQINEDAFRPFPSVSGLDCWVTCPFKWWLKYVRRIERKPHEQSPPLLMGRAWDEFQERFFTSRAPIEYSNDPPPNLNLHPALDAFSCAKVKAMSRAFCELFNPDVLGRFGSTPCQAHVTRELGPENARITLHGHLDRVRSTDSFAETKFTSWPGFHDCLLYNRHQLGVYFLLWPGFTEARIEIAYVPQLQYKDGADPAAFEQRCYDAIMLQPAKYFIGYKKNLGIYGKSFFRSEIALDLLEHRILCHCKEVAWVLSLAGRYPERNPGPFAQKTRNCVMGKSPCEYMDICKRRVSLRGELMINDMIYDIGKVVE